MRPDRFKQVNLVPNFVTAFSLACGLFVIFKTVEIKIVPTYELIHGALILLLISAIADFLDGAIARAMKAESEFGFLFDTLSDAITFGVAPSVLAIKYLSGLETEGKWLFFSLACSMVYSICGVLRLVRFQILTKQSRGNQQEEFKLKRAFVGLPIPASALAFSSMLLFLSSEYAEILTKELKLGLLNGYSLILAYLMVSRWKFPSLKSLHIRVPSFNLIFLSVMIAIVLFYGVLYYLPLGVVSITFGYILFGAVLTFIRFWQGRRFRKLTEKK
jgi:CDP-diacylglycerol--serine O-phosphatidyltransferase